MTWQVLANGQTPKLNWININSNLWLYDQMASLSQYIWFCNTIWSSQFIHSDTVFIMNGQIDLCSLIIFYLMVDDWYNADLGKPSINWSQYSNDLP
jgi:hypothetical protein